MTPAEILAAHGPREKPWTTTWSIVGAGPAGLATAIRLKQVAATQGREVCRWWCWKRAPSPARTSCRAR
jgi:electron-transferring-flavoprotein dehydrogenase